MYLYLFLGVKLLSAFFIGIFAPFWVIALAVAALLFMGRCYARQAEKDDDDGARVEAGTTFIVLLLLVLTAIVRGIVHVLS